MSTCEMNLGVFFGLFVIALLGAFIAGVAIGKDEQCKRAIADGVAHYTVNPTNGETKFEWKRCQ